MIKFMLVFFFLLLMIRELAMPLYSQQGQEEELVFVPGEVVVSFQDQTTTAIESKNSVFTSPWASIRVLISDPDLIDVVPLFTQNSPLKNVFLFKFKSDVDINIKLEAIRKEPLVKQVERNFIFEVDVTPNDFYFNTDFNASGELDRWTLYKMQANRAWNIAKGDASVLVGVVDTGLDFEHPDLDLNVWINADEDINGNGKFDNYSVAQGGDLDSLDNDNNNYVDDVVGWDWWQGDNVPHHDTTQIGSHGSIVGSIVSSETDNNYGIAGITWHSKIMALKIGEGSYINPAYAVPAINYAIEKGAQIINMSFSSIADLASLHEVIKTGDSLGVIFVGSAGDHNNEWPRYPGSYEEVIRVAVVDSSDHKTDGSSYADDVFISAPSARTGSAGHGIVICAYGSWDSLYPGDQPPHHFLYSEIATSGGAAEVSGVLALLKSAYPAGSTSFIKNELARGAKQLPYDESMRDKLGAGRVNAYRSLTQWGTLANDTAWTSVAYVSGDLSVASGKTLAINPGTIIYVDGDDNENTGNNTSKIEFNVYGSLNINGTSQNPVVFQSWQGNGRTDWVGIRFMSGSTGGNLDHVIIKNAEIGIKHLVPITMTNSTISDCEAGIESHDDLDLSNSTVTQCTDFGISILKGTGTLDIDTISNCDQYGVWSYPYYGSMPVSLTATNSYIHDNGIYGISVSGSISSVDLQQSTIENNYLGLSISGTTQFSVSNNNTIKNNNTGIIISQATSAQQPGLITSSTVKDNTTNGIWLSDTNVPIISNTIDNNATGISCVGATTDPAVAANTISNNNGGIKCDQNAEGTFANNVISANSTGAGGLNGGNPNLGQASTAGSNSFRNNTGLDVSNLTIGLTIMAENNYWGRRGPLPSKFYGSVDYTPWLTNDPNPVAPDVPTEDRDVDNEQPPTKYSLNYSYPNPFNPSTTIGFDVPPPGSRVRIAIYDVQGRLVMTLLDDVESPGTSSVSWNGRDTHGKAVASGVYFVKMSAGTFSETKKLLLMK